MKKWWIAALTAVALLAAGCGSQSPGSQASTKGYSTPLASVQSSTPANVDPGTPLNKMAPNFRLTDQFGKTVSLSQYRGKVVVLAFQDSECTTICPLTSQEMVMAKKMLGAKAASEVALLAVDANPRATSVADVRSYSKVHGTMNSVVFATAPEPKLSQVWKSYDIYVAVVKGAIDHTPGVFLINPKGKEKRVYLTQMAYNGIGQQALVFAQELARLIPNPTKASQAVLHRGLKAEATVHRLSNLKMPLAKGRGTVTVTDGQPHLLVFTASWLSQLSNVPQQLDALNQYQTYATAHSLPSLITVDEAPTEPSAHAFPALLAQAGTLDYPVAVDKTGAAAAAVGVQDITWYAVVNSRGKIIWAHDGSNKWLTPTALEDDVARAMTSKHS